VCKLTRRSPNAVARHRLGRRRRRRRRRRRGFICIRRRRRRKEEEEFFNHYKNDLERHAHTPSGVARADLKSQSGVINVSLSPPVAQRVQVAEHNLRRRRVPPYMQDDLAFPATVPSSDV